MPQNSENWFTSIKTTASLLHGLITAGKINMVFKPRSSKFVLEIVTL